LWHAQGAREKDGPPPPPPSPRLDTRPQRRKCESGERPGWIHRTLPLPLPLSHTHTGRAKRVGLFHVQRSSSTTPCARTRWRSVARRCLERLRTGFTTIASSASPVGWPGCRLARFDMGTPVFPASSGKAAGAATGSGPRWGPSSCRRALPGRGSRINARMGSSGALPSVDGVVVGCPEFLLSGAASFKASEGGGGSGGGGGGGTDAGWKEF
jgi:hypothetical protein